MKVLSIASQKGGVGKTTTAVTLAHGLALAGRRVLLVDLDSQGHIALSFGRPKAPGLRRLLVDGEQLAAVAVEVRPGGPWAVLSDKTTDSVRNHVINTPFGERLLAKAMTAADGVFDVAILDFAPSLDALHVSGLVASDFVVIPTSPSLLSADGLNEILKSIATVAENGHPLNFAILPCQFDRITRESTAQLKELRRFGAKVWPPIPNDVKVKEAVAFGQTLYEHAPAAPSLLGFPAADGKPRLGGYVAIIDLVQKVINGKG